MNLSSPRQFTAASLIVTAACIVLFALVTVTAQVWQLGASNGERVSYLETVQVERNRAVLERRAGDSWRYRLLAPYVVEAARSLAEQFSIPNATVVTYVAFRLLQNAAIFALVYAYYRRLGFSWFLTLLGLSVLAWAMSHSNYGSDLSYNTYFDLIFYLLAALAVLYGRSVWVIPAALVAATNRETGVFIPLLLAADALVSVAGARRRKLAAAALALGGFGLVTLLIRVAVGETVYSPEYTPLHLLQDNLLSYQTYFLLFLTMGIVPLLAVVSLRYWTRWLRLCFWLIVPAWFVLHAFLSAMAETRLFLVPFAIVFVPGLLYGIARQWEQSSL